MHWSSPKFGFLWPSENSLKILWNWLSHFRPHTASQAVLKKLVTVPVMKPSTLPYSAKTCIYKQTIYTSPIPSHTGHKTTLTQNYQDQQAMPGESKIPLFDSNYLCIVLLLNISLCRNKQQRHNNFIWSEFLSWNLVYSTLQLFCYWIHYRSV